MKNHLLSCTTDKITLPVLNGALNSSVAMFDTIQNYIADAAEGLREVQLDLFAWDTIV